MSRSPAIALLAFGACSFSATGNGPADGSVAGVDAALPACLDDNRYEILPANGHGYRRDTDPLDFDQAEMACAADGAYLATVETPEENAMLDGMLPQNDAYIGLDDRFAEDQFAWITGEALGADFWNSPPEPNNSQDEDCTVLLAQVALWNDVQCEGARRFFCECDPAGGPRLPACASDPAYDLRIKGRAYRLDTTGASWADARDSCAADGAYLAAIGDNRENAGAAAALAGTQMWIGYSDRAQEGTFAWENGAPTDYTNFGAPPDDAGGNEDCVEMFADGTWNDAPCTLESPYLCECDLVSR